MISKYRDIADALREQYRHAPAGVRLPSEQTLMDRFNATRATVRLAKYILREEGLIESRQGSGVYVRPRLEVWIERIEGVAREVDNPRAAQLLRQATRALREAP